MYFILAIVVIPIFLFIIYITGAVIKATLFKEKETNGILGVIINIVLGCVFLYVIDSAFKGCNTDTSNNPSIDYDGSK
jgi:hypothetical protein